MRPSRPSSLVSALRRYPLHVGGQWTDAADGRVFESDDPFTGTPWAAVPEASVADADAAVRAARAALDGEWGAITGFERARLMHRLADLIERNVDHLAAVETRDN